jgi:hypothetical protein
MCGILLAQGPQWYQDNKKSCKMSKEGDGFEHRQGLGTPRVEEYGDDQKGKHHERVLPIWEPGKVDIGGFNHGLNLCCDDESAAGDASKPSQSRYPS